MNAIKSAAIALREQSLQPDPRQLSLVAIITAFKAQCRVIHALIMRETLTRYGDYKIGFLWGFLEPLAAVLIFAGIFAAIRTDSPSGMPLFQFMLTGFVPFTLFRGPWGQMQSAIGQNKALLSFPQVTTFDVLAARCILEVLITLLVFGILLMGCHLVGFEIRVERPMEVLYALGLLTSIGAGMGFLFAALEPLIPSVKKLTTTILGRPLFLGSGLFFTAETIPMPARDYLLYNPIIHCLELLRGAFFYEFETNHGSWEYATAWALGSLAVGLTAHRALRRRSIVGL
ncbi:MAG: ABC transporter permease [Gammaproteobacteria bacterium]|nr:ABC transporter permease [Gammaproteobacteria bacterium]